MIILNYIKLIFFKNNVKEKIIVDELIGRWENYDDGSGLHTMIWGYGIEFLEENIAIYYSWENKKNEEDKIIWKRINHNTIEIKFKEENQFETITYSIQKSKQGYNIDCLEISEINKKRFWFSPEPLYKNLRS